MKTAEQSDTITSTCFALNGAKLHTTIFHGAFRSLGFYKRVKSVHDQQEGLQPEAVERFRTKFWLSRHN